MSEWIEWKGGEMPPVDSETKVEVKFLSGDVSTGKAWHYDWWHDGVTDDIIAYRVVR